MHKDIDWQREVTWLIEFAEGVDEVEESLHKHKLHTMLYKLFVRN